MYESFVFFLLPGSGPNHPAVAAFVYDEDYLRKNFSLRC